MSNDSKPPSRFSPPGAGPSPLGGSQPQKPAGTSLIPAVPPAPKQAVQTQLLPAIGEQSPAQSPSPLAPEPHFSTQEPLERSQAPNWAPNIAGAPPTPSAPAMPSAAVPGALGNPFPPQNTQAAQQSTAPHFTSPSAPMGGFGLNLPPGVSTSAYHQHFHSQQSGSEPLALVSLILGILTFVFGWCCSPIGLVMGLAAITCGIIALRRGPSLSSTDRTMAIIGIIAPSLSILLIILMFAFSFVPLLLP